MEYVIIIIKVFIFLSILNVWFLRFNKQTSWRGGQAANMKEEFQVYGLPGWSVQIVGFLKLLFAVCLIAGIWFQQLTRPAALGLAVLMLVAVVMHIKVKDPLKKSLPVLTMLVLSLIVSAS